MPRSLIALVALAAALRFWQIGDQSFWLDEAFTVDVVDGSFGDMLSGVAATESTPPLYYVLAWLWEKVFGHGEAGLRSLSALIGVAAVPVAFAAARAWCDERAGLVAAALVAVNPFFVWYSQEARSYSLLVLTAALTLLFLGQRKPWLWALSAVLALCTHYFAAFLIVPEAAWLVWTMRAAWPQVGAVALAGAALAPLALHQRDLGHTTFIADLSLKTRLFDLPKKLVTGELGTPTPLIGGLSGLLIAAAALYALRVEPRVRPLAAIAAAAALLPIAGAIVDVDYLLPRNLIAVFAAAMLVVAAGLAAARAAGVAAAVVVCAVAIVVNVQVTGDAKLQRDDWRGAARALGQPTEPRAVLVTPEWERKPLRLYAGSLPAATAQTPVRELVAIRTGRPPLDPAAPPGFTETSRKRTASYILVRYRSPVPRPAPAATTRTATLLQSP